VDSPELASQDINANGSCVFEESTTHIIDNPINETSSEEDESSVSDNLLDYHHLQNQKSALEEL